MSFSKRKYTFSLDNTNKPIDNDIVKDIIKDREDSLENIALKYKTKEDTISANKRTIKKYIKHKTSKVNLAYIMFVMISIIAVAIFIGIGKYIEQKHIDSGTPYIRFNKPEGYLIEQIKLKDGAVWDILCIDGVKTIYDIDKRLVSETNLACF